MAQPASQMDCGENRMLLDIENVIAEAPYLGNGPDKHDPDITMHLFETTLHNEKAGLS